MTWLPLSSWVLEARATLRSGRVPLSEIGHSSRLVLAATAIFTWGEQRAREHPAVVNVAGLGFSMLDRLVLHRWTRDAADMVHATDLHSLPDEPPRLLRQPWLVETPHPERGQALFGTTVCLGGYYLDDDPSCWWLIGLQWPDGITVAQWHPHWTGEEIAEGIPYDTSPLIDDVTGHREWGIEAARFAVVAGLLLDAASSPIRTESADGSRAAQKRAARAVDQESWAVKRVVLAGPPITSSNSGSGGEAVGADGRSAVDAAVRGHLKRQRHGPRGELRRWIWVEGYQARRWVSAKPLRVDVRVN